MVAAYSVGSAPHVGALAQGSELVHPHRCELLVPRRPGPANCRLVTGVAGMRGQAQSSTARRDCPPLQLEREHQVGELGLAVGQPVL